MVSPSGHYDLLYRAEPPHPIVNYQYSMSNYLPTDYTTLSFDANWHLMSIPNLMVDPSFHLGATTMAPVTPPTYLPPPSRNMYYSPTPSPQTPSPMTSPLPTTHPLGSMSNKSSDGPQIRLNPLVMKPNLSHSLPVTTPFKK
jgi:ubiquitin thioesterase protein OTUB1